MSAHHVPARGGMRPYVAMLLASVVLLLTGAQARAHSFVKSTSPKGEARIREAPVRVVMRFNEAVEIAFGAIRVEGPDGGRVDEGTPTYEGGSGDAVQVGLAPRLANGRYTVRWRVVSADGHPRRGRFSFVLDAPVSETMEPSPSPSEPTPDDEVMGAVTTRDEGTGSAAPFALGVTRWLIFSSLLLLCGLVLFRELVWTRPKHSFGDRPEGVVHRFEERWTRLARRAWWTGMVATVTSVFLQGSVAAEVPLSEVSFGLAGQVLGTRFGWAAALRVGLLIVGAVAWRSALGGARQGIALPQPDPAGSGPVTATVTRRRIAPLPILWTAMLLLTVGLAAHAGTTDPVWANLGADLLHLLGAATWAGGLAALLTAFAASRGEEPRTRITTMAPLISRFSDVAVAAIAVVVATGVFRSWIELQALRELLGSGYGRTLAIKLAVFVPVLVLGAINNRVTKPACEMALLTGEEDRGSLDRLRRLVAIEVALAVAIIAVTAVLVNMTPPRAIAEGGAHL